MNAAERYERLMAVFDEVRKLDAALREQRLEALCEGDIELRHEVESMLEHEPIGASLFEAAEDGRGIDAFAAALVDTPLDAPALPEEIGGYRVIRQIGEGGMGIIYEATQESPHRRVAIKVLRSNLVTPAALRRFRHETHVLGQLQHPGIAQIIEAGVFGEGRARHPYFTMEIIDGSPIDVHARQALLEPRQCAELIARLCDAVQHAHQKGIIHRDLKPNNVLVVAQQTTGGDHAAALDSGSGTTIDAIGLPKVLDFGIARAIDPEYSVTTMHTQAGDLIGTLAYMSPEQVRGDTNAIDTRCDVYAIGVILYELLVGRRPHDLAGKPIPEAARIVQDHEPTALASFDKSLRGDLETIVARAIDKDLERRYRTAAALADDLRRFLRHEPIAARRATALYQMQKFARRNTALVIGMLATITALVAGVIGTTWFALDAKMANEASARSEYSARIAAAAAALREDDIATMSQFLDAAPEAHRGWEWEYLQCQLDECFVSATISIEGRASARSSTWYSSDGAQLYFALRHEDARLSVETRDPNSLELLDRWSIDGHIAHAPLVDDSALFVATEHGVALHDVRSGEIREQLDGFFRPGVWRRLTSRLSLSPYLMETFSAGGLELSEKPSAVSPDGKRVFMCSLTEIRVIDMAPPHAFIELEPHPDGVGAVAFSPDGRYVVTGGHGRRLLCFDLESGGERVWAVPGGHTGAILAVAFSDDGSLVASGGAGHVLKLWNGRTGEPAGSFHGHQDAIRALAFNPDGTRVSSVSRSTEKVWSIAPDPQDDAKLRHAGSVRSLAMSADGRLLATTGRDARIYDVESGRLVASIAPPCPGAELCGAYLTPDNRRLVIGVKSDQRWLAHAIDLRNGEVERLDLDLHAIVDSVQEHQGLGRLTLEQLRDRPSDEIAMALSLIGRIWRSAIHVDSKSGLIAANHRASESTRLYRAGSHDLVAEFEEKWSGAAHLFLGGSRLALGRSPGKIVVLDVGSGKELGTLHGHSDEVTSIVWLPEQRRLASGSKDRTIRIWDLDRMECVAVLRGHLDVVLDLAVTPDGEALFSGSSDYTVRRWETRPVSESLRAGIAYDTMVAELLPRVRGLREQFSDSNALFDRIERLDDLSDREREIAHQLALRLAVEARTR